MTRLENYNKEELVTIMTSLKCSKEYDVPDVGVRGCMCAVRSVKTKVLNNKTNKIMKYSKTYALTPWQSMSCDWAKDMSSGVTELQNCSLMPLR